MTAVGRATQLCTTGRMARVVTRGPFSLALLALMTDTR